jgi:hypothetical protein
MTSQKVVTPVKTGVQMILNSPEKLDSGFRRNDTKGHFLTCDECVIIITIETPDSLSQALDPYFLLISLHS